MNEMMSEAFMAELESRINRNETGDDGGMQDVFDRDDYVPPPIGGAGLQNFMPIFKDEGKTLKISEGVICVGRQHYLVESEEFKVEYDKEYRIRIKVTITVGGAETKIEEGDLFEAPNKEISYIPLYIATKGAIKKDYRGNFCVVARDAKTE